MAQNEQTTEELSTLGKARSPSVMRRVDGKKGKVFPYSLPNVGPGADPGRGSQPAGDVK